MNPNTGRALKLTAIVLMAATALVTLVSGIGLYCAAFDTASYPTLSAILPYQWLYQIFMVVTTALGLAGGWVVVGLVRGQAGAYRNALLTLTAIAVAAGIHVAVSLALRGKSMPNDIRLYASLLTLLVFLILRLPNVWQYSGFEQRMGGGGGRPAAGAALIVTSVIALTTPLWASFEHWFPGGNWVDVLLWPLLASGVFMLATGLTLLARPATRARLVTADSHA